MDAVSPFLLGWPLELLDLNGAGWWVRHGCERAAGPSMAPARGQGREAAGVALAPPQTMR